MYAKSHSVTLADAFIAATTKLSRAQLWTMNTKHFPMISAEELYDPQ
jgi:predicted nucleic acid-binding protein